VSYLDGNVKQKQTQNTTNAICEPFWQSKVANGFFPALLSWAGLKDDVTSMSLLASDII